MNISNYYWYFSGVLTPKFCDEVIKYASAQKESIARTGGYDKEELTKEDVKNIQKKRKSDLVWLMTLGYIKNYIHMFTKLIDRRVGILIGTDLSLVSLQSIN